MASLCLAWPVSVSHGQSLSHMTSLCLTLSGTTWLQEILWLLMHDGNFAEASKTPVYLRSPFIEFKDDVLGEDGLDLANKMDSPRVLKTHLQNRFMPVEANKKDCKVRLVAKLLGLYAVHLDYLARLECF